MKTNFGESILVTLKIGVATIPAWLGMFLINRFFEFPMLAVLWSLFSLWFVGWTANKLWSWK